MKKKPQSTRRERFADPVLFAEKILGVKLWGLQAEILRSIVTNRRVAVRSCHSSSKTYLAAVAALFWLLRWRDAKVVITGPSFLQVRTVIFGQIHHFLRSMKYRIPADQNQVEIRRSPSNFILGTSTDTPERLQGFHGGHVLVIIDEAPGVEGMIWEAVESLLASGDTHLLAIGNPVVASGAFYDAFTRSLNSWRTFAISWRDTPNFTGIDTIDDLLALPDEELDRNPWPMLLTRRWVADAHSRWWNGGEESSPLWQARVEGQFPSQSSNSLIALAWLEAARKPAADPGGTIRIGIDPAGAGRDESVAVVASDGVIIEICAWSKPDPRGEIVQLLNKYRGRLSNVRVDSAGLGWGLYLHLSDMRYPVTPVNVGSASSAPDRFLNMRAELFWDLAERFKARFITGLTDALTIAQLGSLNYEITSAGKIQIASKTTMAKSPDRADAVMLALGTAGNDVDRWIQKVYGPGGAVEAMRNATPLPENNWKADPLDWWGQRKPQGSPWAAKTCRHCAKPIVDGTPFTQDPGAVFNRGVPYYSRSQCAQNALAGIVHN